MNSAHTVPVKLLPCRRAGAGAELFVVEGDSAASAICAVRQSDFQAVLPMQGKPLNAWRATAARARAQPLFVELQRALAIANPASDSHSPAFERVLLLFDPDADGIHCGALMVLYFYRWLRPFFDAGRLEMVRAPLFEIRYVDASGRQQFAHAFVEEHQREVCARLQTSGAHHFEVRRHRGLGGIDATLLSRWCVDPATRRTVVLRPSDAQAVIDVLGGP